MGPLPNKAACAQQAVPLKGLHCNVLGFNPFHFNIFDEKSYKPKRTLSRVGRAVNTKFVYGCSAKPAWLRLVTFQEPKLGVLMQHSPP